MKKVERLSIDKFKNSEIQKNQSVSINGGYTSIFFDVNTSKEKWTGRLNCDENTGWGCDATSRCEDVPDCDQKSATSCPTF